MSTKMWSKKTVVAFCAAALTFVVGAGPGSATVPIANDPLFFPGVLPPTNMLVMGRDHTLYYEAYNDASDLTGDGVLNFVYQPDRLGHCGYSNFAKISVMKIEAKNVKWQAEMQESSLAESIGDSL